MTYKKETIQTIITSKIITMRKQISKQDKLNKKMRKVMMFNSQQMKNLY